MMTKDKFMAYIETHSSLTGINWDNSLVTKVYCDEVSLGKQGMYEFAAMDDGTIFVSVGHPLNWDVCDYLPSTKDNRIYLELIYEWLKANKAEYVGQIRS